LLFVVAASVFVYEHDYGATLSENVFVWYSILDLLAIIFSILFLLIDISYIVNFVLSRRKAKFIENIFKNC
jgi:hypothetical protein